MLPSTFEDKYAAVGLVVGIARELIFNHCGASNRKRNSASFCVYVWTWPNSYKRRCANLGLKQTLI
jgi:hypothetical protein